MITDQSFLEKCIAKYGFDQYLHSNENERINWRFEYMVNMDYNELLAFFEYCIEPLELQTGIIFNIENDLKEAAQRQQQLNDQLGDQIQQQKKISSHLQKKQQEYQRLEYKQSQLDQVWEKEKEDDKEAFDQLME